MIAELVKNAPFSTPELDARIWSALKGGEFNGWANSPYMFFFKKGEEAKPISLHASMYYSSSMDAAVGLFKREFPGMEYMLEETGGAAYARVWQAGRKDETAITGIGQSPAMAMLDAIGGILDAKLAQAPAPVPAPAARM